MRLTRPLAFFILALVLVGAGVWMARDSGTDGLPTTAVPASQATAGHAGSDGAGSTTPLSGSQALRGLSEAEVLGLIGEEHGRVLSSHMMLDDFNIFLTGLVTDLREDAALTEDERLLLIHYFDSMRNGIGGHFDPKYSEAARTTIREKLPSNSDVEDGAKQLLSVFREQSRKRLEEMIDGPIPLEPLFGRSVTSR